MKKIVLLNGPPRSGKDTVAEALIERFPAASHRKFAEPLRSGVQSIFGLSDDQWDELYLNNKETPSPLLGGLSARDAMIWLSEEAMKPKFGRDIFGKLAARQFKADPANLIIVSDSGFAREVDVICTEFGTQNVTLFRLIRDGCNFKNDSRGYVTNNDIASVGIFNNGPIEDTVNVIAYCIERFIEEKPNESSANHPVRNH